MSVGIVIPLKSRKVSRDWDATCRTLKATLLSVLNQSSNDYRIVVVGHDIPGFLHDLKRGGSPIFHSFLELETPEVHDRHDLKDKMKLLDRDKNMKVAKGIALLRSYYSDINFWYPLDSDDLVHRDLVKLILDSTITHGRVINNGYFWYKDINRIISAGNLSAYCGSTLILADRHIPEYSEIDDNTLNTIPFCNTPHMHYLKFLTETLGEAEPILKESLLTYTLASGDNISDGYRDSWLQQIKQKLKPFILGKKPDKAFYTDFSI